MELLFWMLDFETRIEGQLRFDVAEAYLVSTPHFMQRPEPLQVQTLKPMNVLQKSIS